MLLKRLFLSYPKAVNRLHQITHGGNNASPNFNIVPFDAILKQRDFSTDITHATEDGQKPVTVSLYQMKKIIKGSSSALGDCIEGATCIQTICPVCHIIPGGSDSKSPEKSITDGIRNRIFVNKTTGNFTCSSCQYQGRWDHIEKFFLPYSRSPKTVQELRKLRDAFLELKKEQMGAAYPMPGDIVALDTIENALNAIRQLQLENIFPETLIAVKACWHEGKKELFIPLVDVEDRPIGYKTIYTNSDGEICERTVPETNASGLIYLRCSTSGPSTKTKDHQSQSNAILVLNVPDLLALGSVKLNATAVCLPHGLKTLPQQCLPGLERFQRLTLWFNYDTAGWDTARNYAKKLDERRCLFVRPTDQHPTPYKAMQEGIVEPKAILAKALPILHQSITTFRSLRQDVLSDLQNIDKVQGVKWKRYPTLNKLLKGHRKGELTVLTGPTGCGKTTFMSDYSLDLAQQGVSTLWGSFEIRNTRLAVTLLRQMVGRPLDENLGEFEQWADTFERLPIYFMTFHGQQPIKLVMEAIEHAQYVHDIQHVIIDNLQFMMGVLDEAKHLDRYWKQDAIIAAFRTFATRRNCHVTLVIHPRKERDSDELTTSSIFGGAKASQEADNVLIIQDKRLTSVRGKKYLQVAKNRYSGDLGIMPLDFDKASLSYAQRKKKPEGGSDDGVPPSTNEEPVNHPMHRTIGRIL
ncbi:mitochondrial DNA helicase [Anopheles nili]|uniref:mitochondrial DNA helicase n=1 Tax=Anopheles nili TaxID=185578 RepID=UPI00237B0AE7|nr:mitochondrial DNA helicase [Anopheles nili]